MKRFLMTTALVAVGTTGAIAQDADERFRADNADAIYASDFIGMRVYSTEAQAEGEVAGYEGVQDNWEDIGEINDIVLTREGNVDAVLVDIGGFLGFGAKPVLTPLTELRVMQSPDGDEVKVHIARTGDDLSPALYLMATAVVSLIVLLTIPETSGKEIHTSSG